MLCNALVHEHVLWPFYIAFCFQDCRSSLRRAVFPVDAEQHAQARAARGDAPDLLQQESLVYVRSADAEEYLSAR